MSDEFFVSELFANRDTNSPNAPCNVERRPALLVLLGGVSAFVEQDGRDVGVAIERGQVQRRPAPVVRVDVDAVLEQRADCVGLPVPVSTSFTAFKCFRRKKHWRDCAPDGEVQGVPALILRVVHPRARLDEQPRLLRLPVPCCQV